MVEKKPPKKPTCIGWFLQKMDYVFLRKSIKNGTTALTHFTHTQKVGADPEARRSFTGFQAQIKTSDSWPRRTMALLWGISTSRSTSIISEWLSTAEGREHSQTKDSLAMTQIISQTCTHSRLWGQTLVFQHWATDTDFKLFQFYLSKKMTHLCSLIWKKKTKTKIKYQNKGCSGEKRCSSCCSPH